MRDYLADKEKCSALKGRKKEKRIKGIDKRENKNPYFKTIYQALQDKSCSINSNIDTLVPGVNKIEKGNKKAEKKEEKKKAELNQKLISLAESFDKDKKIQKKGFRATKGTFVTKTLAHLKFAPVIGGLIAPVFGVVGAFFSVVTSSISALFNYNKRQNELKLLSNTAERKVIPNVQGRKWHQWLRGVPSKFDKYLLENKERIGNELGVGGSELSLKKIKGKLEQPEFRGKFKEYLRESTKEEFNKKLTKFRDGKPVSSEEKHKEVMKVIKGYTEQCMGKHAFWDTFKAGAMNTVKLAIAANMLSVAFPFLAPFLGAASGVIIGAGLIGSAIAAAVERWRFRNRTRNLFKESTRSNPSFEARQLGSYAMQIVQDLRA